MCLQACELLSTARTTAGQEATSQAVLARLGCRAGVYLVASSSGSGAVQALVDKATQAHVVADNVQHAHHLAEDQHPAPGVAVSGASKAAASQSGNQTLQCTAAAQTLSGQWPTTCSITSALSSSTSPDQPRTPAAGPVTQL